MNLEFSALSQIFNIQISKFFSMKKVFFLVFLCFSFGLFAQTDSIRHAELSEIVVSVTRANRRTPTTYTNLTAMEVNRAMVMPEIPSAIGFSPSVVMTSENGAAIGSQSFRIRGSDATRINVTFDGVPINDGESLAVFWTNMPNLTSSLATMQIQRGVGASTNGAASFGATLNMQSAQPTAQPYANADAAFGSFNTFKMNIAAGTGRSSKGWNADMRYSTGQTDGYVDNGYIDQYSLFFAGGYTGNQRIVKLNVFHGNQKTGITWTGVPDDMIEVNRRYNPAGMYTDSEGNTVRHNNETDNYRQTHVHLHYIEQLSDRFRFNATLYYTRGKGYDERFRINRRMTEFLPDYVGTPSRSNLIIRRWLDNNLTGINATASYTTDKTLAHVGISGNIYENWHFGNIIWIEQPIAEISDNFEWYFNAGNKTDVSTFIKITHQFAQRWHVFGDIQWRNIGYNVKGIDRDGLKALAVDLDYNFFNPKAGVTFAISPHQRAYASFAVGRREPARTDIKDAFGTKDMPSPETLYNVETGYELYNGTWTLGANFFYMHYKNQLVNTGRISDTGYLPMENVPVSYRTGIEMNVECRPVSALQINGNITYSINKIKDYVAYVDAYDSSWNVLSQVEEHFGTTDISYSPQWVGASEIFYEIVKGLTVGMTAKYVGKQYYDNTSSDDRRLDAYFVNNGIIQYKLHFGKYHAGLQFAANNLWNEDYISNAYVNYRSYVGGIHEISSNFFPQPFRNYMVKLTVGF